MRRAEKAEGVFSLERARERAREHVIETARSLGLQVDSPEDAWGAVVAVQARIALDPEAGSKATAAAKLVAQATGWLDVEAGEVEAEQGLQRIKLDAEGAEQLLEWIKERRGADGKKSGE